MNLRSRGEQMIVNCFSDHLAYTLEQSDSMFMLGMRFVKKKEADLISAVDITYNDRIRLLYGTEEYRPLFELAANLNSSELALALIRFIREIRRIEDNDFLRVTAIDIDFNRLFYDVKSKSIKFVVLPVNYECDFHDGETWSSSFRKTVLILLNYIFVNMPGKYQETYYAIADTSKTDDEVLDYILNYEFGLDSAGNAYTASAGESSAGTAPVLEHKGADGNIRFVVNKSQFMLGKSKDADGVIAGSTMVSRNHCRITKAGNSYMVEDLNSTNGTAINGYSLKPGEVYYLNHGDILALADVEFRVLLG